MTSTSPQKVAQLKSFNSFQSFGSLSGKVGKFCSAPLPKLPWQRNALVLGTGLIGIAGLAGIAVLANGVGTNVKSATEWPTKRWAAAEKTRTVRHRADYNQHKLKVLESERDYRQALMEGALIRGVVVATATGLLATAAFSPRRKVSSQISPRVNSQIGPRVSGHTRTSYVGKRLAIGGGFLGAGYITREDLRRYYPDYLAAEKNLQAFESTTLKTSHAHKTPAPKTLETSTSPATSSLVTVQFPPSVVKNQ